MSISRKMAQILSATRITLQDLAGRPVLATVVIVGYAAVVGILITVLSLGHGLAATLEGAGSNTVALVMSSGARSEVRSQLGRATLQAVVQAPGIERRSGTLMVAPEVVSTVILPKIGNGTPSNIMMRGVLPMNSKIHLESHIIAGRMFRPGLNEVVAGVQASQEYQHLKLGDQFKFSGKMWKVVGIFAANGNVHESEIWTDLHELQSTLNFGDSFSFVNVKLQSPQLFGAFSHAIKDASQRSVQVLREETYYRKLSEGITGFLFTAGYTIALLMGLGAIIGAINIMSAILTSQLRDIAILRALGFHRSATFIAVLVEGVGLGLIGGVIGAAISYAAFNGYQASTLSGGAGLRQIAFQFAVTPDLLLLGLGYALLMGLLGSYCRQSGQHAFPCRQFLEADEMPLNILIL
jgi:putative ABC transport system permease protein